MVADALGISVPAAKTRAHRTGLASQTSVNVHGERWSPIEGIPRAETQRKEVRRVFAAMRSAVPNSPVNLLLAGGSDNLPTVKERLTRLERERVRIEGDLGRAASRQQDPGISTPR
jgi:hypothetical protein